MSKLKIAIAGATGYSGEELIRLLLNHPHVEITHLAASAKWDKPALVSDVFPRFARLSKLQIESLEPQRLAASCDIAFLALPHGVAMELAPDLLSAGKKVIDLSGDFRLKDAALFTQWYGKAHTSGGLLKDAVYGIPELAGPAIAKANLIANPGCYATSVILACAPLLQSGLVERDWMVIDAKSGLTGAGRKAEPDLMFAEMNENLWAYKVNHHQHVPEIEQALAPFSGGQPLGFCFVPHIIPVNRGILSSIYLRLAKQATWQQVDKIYRDFYRNAPFIRIRPENQWPQLRDVQGTNYCDIAFAVDVAKRGLIVSAAIDNLLKGASGQAVQNMNLMCGWPEATGLL